MPLRPLSDSKDYFGAMEYVLDYTLLERGCHPVLHVLVVQKL